MNNMKIGTRLILGFGMVLLLTAVLVAVGAIRLTSIDESATGLIEKEWVEKAKKVIAETRHDPHLQEREVSKLQADYLQKRYGKSVKLPSDG